MTDSILLSKDDNGVATVTLNRPDKHNAFDDRIIAELSDVFNNVDTDDAVKVVVLAANGKSFSAGADLQWMKRIASYSYDDNLADAKKLADMLRILNTLSKPTIARVQGAAFGGAIGLISCCDIAVGTPNTNFSLSEVKIGLIPATISPYVISAIGERAARRYFLTAERFSAEQALKLGLLSELVQHEGLDQAISTLTRALLANCPAAMAAAKRLISDIVNKPITAPLIEDTSERIARTRVSAEGQEGLAAFLEKRPANWNKTNNSKP